MVDRLFKGVFRTIDTISGTQAPQEKHADNAKLSNSANKNQHEVGPIDKSLCPIHKNKKAFFCDQCMLELCANCKDRHDKTHSVWFMEETSAHVTLQFQEGMLELSRLRKQLQQASKKDPTMECQGAQDALSQGNQMIDYIYEKIQRELEESRQELKDNFKEAYIMNFKTTVDRKSQNFLQQLDKLQQYIEGTLNDFGKMKQKQKLGMICSQKPRIVELQQQLKKFETAFDRMCEKACEFRQEYQIYFSAPGFDNDLKILLNKYINVSCPGLENGVFKVHNCGGSPISYQSLLQLPQQHYQTQTQSSQSYNISNDSFNQSEEKYDIRQHGKQPLLETAKGHSAPIQSDAKYEMKTLKYSKDKFLVKTFDTQKKKGSVVEITMPEQIWRIATKFYGYVALENDILMCGGQFIEDKACSIDTYRIEINKNTLRDTKQYMKVARMHHSMIYVEETGHTLVVGGEDENGGLLDSCEILSKYEIGWKTLYSLNQKGKNVGLCKFVVESKPLNKIYIYAFGRSSVERIEMSKTSSLDSRWEELKFKAKDTFPLPLMSNSLQFNESFIIINGGVDNLGSATKEVLFFDTHNNIIQKVTSELQVNDKFTGAAMTQNVIDRLECKIYICSESFVHEVDYTGDAKFQYKATFY